MSKKLETLQTKARIAALTEGVEYAPAETDPASRF
jgi:hypothetical protein